MIARRVSMPTVARGARVSDVTTDFFESLRRREHEPLLEHAEGTLRFELADNGHVDHWFVAVDDGDVAVSHRPRRVVEGDIDLLTRFQRLFPAPPRDQ
jgi:hypothetical protein